MEKEETPSSGKSGKCGFSMISRCAGSGREHRENRESSFRTFPIPDALPDDLSRHPLVAAALDAFPRAKVSVGPKRESLEDEVPF
jgi:hypothetical protein